MTSTRPRALRLVAAVLAVALAAGLWLWQMQERRSLEDSRAEDRAAVAAAESETLAWASVDHRDVDAYVERVTSGATGEFLTQFEQSEQALRTLLADNQSVQVPVIPEDGVALLERDRDRALVLVAMDATVTNKATKQPQPRQYRLQVTMEKVDGRWLTSGLEFIDEQS